MWKELDGATMIVTIWSTLTHDVLFSFQCNTLGRTAVNCLHVLQLMKKQQGFGKDFLPGPEDISPDIISPERVMSLHLYSGGTTI